jgi:hemoglobin
VLGVYWKGKCIDSMNKDNQLVPEFLFMAFGGPSRYLGRDMKTSHTGLAITDDEWDIFARHATATLDSLGIHEQGKTEFLAAAERLKPDIVEVPPAQEALFYWLIAWNRQSSARSPALWRIRSDSRLL